MRARLAAILLMLFFAVGAGAQDDRLRGLDAHIEKAMADWKIPDLAVAIVKDERALYLEQGVSTQAQQLPARTFSSRGFGLELIWKKPLGSGYSRIAVADGRGVTMFSDGEFDRLVALDVDTGEEIWRYQIATTYRGHDGSQDGPI